MIVIFLGPSLPLAEAQAILPDALYLPPAGQADLLSVVTTHQPRVIGLIDGVFAQSLSVWHKEILYALEKGVWLYGASSMGALRAAETAPFGMIGVGEIYSLYAAGTLSDDDEVALAHGPAETGYRPLSEPMINVRFTFQQAQQQGLLSATECEALTTLAKAIYFPERSWPRLFRDAAAAGLPEDLLVRLEQIVTAHYVDAKARDARALLSTLRDLPPDLPPFQADFTLTRSHLFQALYHRDRMVQHQQTTLSLDTISTHLALHHPEFDTLNFHALNRALVGVLADLLEVSIEPDAVEQESQRFRRARGLTEEEALSGWLVANHLSPDEFTALMHQVALCRRLHRWLLTRRHMEGNSQILLDELRLHGEYETWVARAADQERLLEAYPDFKEQSTAQLSARQLLAEHAHATGRQWHIAAREWAEEAGFQGRQDLMIELLRARQAREALRQLAAPLFDALAE